MTLALKIINNFKYTYSVEHSFETLHALLLCESLFVCLFVRVSAVFLNAYICLSWFGVKPLMSRQCTLSLARLPICVHSMCLYSLVCIPCSCSTSLISLRHLSCVFSHVFFIHACLPPCPEAVSSMVWRRIETGMGCLELGRTTNLGQRVFFFFSQCSSHIYAMFYIKGTIIETRYELHMNILLFF